MIKFEKFFENNNSEMIRVYPVKDESGHWYVIPYELNNNFWNDLENEDIVDNGEFDRKWGKYRTGGDLNLIPFYTKKEYIK
jgi:hypothetical protein